MREIHSRYKILGECPTDMEEAIKRIELAGRTAYQSQDKITQDSATKFCKMISDRGHYAVIEHSNLVIKMPYTFALEFPIGYHLPFHLIEREDDFVYISGNFRAWLELEGIPMDLKILINNSLTSVTGATLRQMPESQYEIVHDQDEIPLGLKRISVLFVIPRSVSHEMVRHRPCSFLQESTRYCRYGDINAIQPPGLSENQKNIWKQSILHAEKAYSELLDSGARPEIARAVLPICLKTEIMVTASVPEWEIIFGLRCSPAAHPEFRDLACGLKKDFLSSGWL